MAAVLFGCGIGTWFALSQDPGNGILALVMLGALSAFMLGCIGPMRLRMAAFLLLAIAGGFLVAELRARIREAPVLAFRYHGPVEGLVEEIDRSASDALRITLSQVVLERMDPMQTPLRVRVALHGDLSWHMPAPGERVILTATLAAPEPAAEPGGFDFARMAWFEQLGAVGYTRTPVLLLDPPTPGMAWIGRLRQHLSEGIRARIPGQAGAFASGAMTGDRSGINQQVVEDLRDSSLAHILAISGMNLAFLGTFTFALIRGGIALLPVLALRVDGRKIAAVITFFVAWFYLLLSGSNVATERAFLMFSVMLGAVLMDRRAISLRTAALAGLIMLAWRPESLFAPGFQMSMAATVALIAGFRALEGRMAAGHMPRWLLPVFTLVLSSLIGGLATAPYAAAHFNRFADYGVIANILTVPAMGLLIMPMGALAFLLVPFGLQGLPLWAMGKGAEWILFIADRVARMEGSVTMIPSPDPLVLPLVTLAMLWLILWRGGVRWLSLPVLALALNGWAATERPALLISGDGRIAGLIVAEGRAISTPRGGGFAASNWLENDGDPVDQAYAAARPGFTGPEHARSLVFEGRQLLFLHGNRGLAELAPACAQADLVVLSASAGRPAAVPSACSLIDGNLLRRTGALAFHPLPSGGVEVRASRETTRIFTGDRPFPIKELHEILPEGWHMRGPS